jgi:hypothetical protein
LHTYTLGAIDNYIPIQIKRGHQCDHDSGLLSDFCDGEVFRSHPLFSVHSTALQIFYYDDLEVCNPLGSKAKIHKLSKLIISDKNKI